MTPTTAPPHEDLAATIEQALAQPTLCAAFQVTAAGNAERPALRHVGAGAEEAITFAQAAARVERIAGGLAAHGFAATDTLALMLDNRNEFHLADLAALHLGGLPFSIYDSNPVEKVIPLLENARCRIAVAEPTTPPCCARPCAGARSCFQRSSWSARTRGRAISRSPSSRRPRRPRALTSPPPGGR